MDDNPLMCTRCALLAPPGFEDFWERDVPVVDMPPALHFKLPPGWQWVSFKVNANLEADYPVCPGCLTRAEVRIGMSEPPSHGACCPDCPFGNCVPGESCLLNY